MYFVLEMFVKVMGLGPQLYASDNYNIFDALVTVLGGVSLMHSLLSEVCPSCTHSFALNANKSYRPNSVTLTRCSG